VRLGDDDRHRRRKVVQQGASEIFNAPAPNPSARAARAENIFGKVLRHHAEDENDNDRRNSASSKPPQQPAGRHKATIWIRSVTSLFRASI
jgi:hypothetical protein